MALTVHEADGDYVEDSDAHDAFYDPAQFERQ